MDTRSGHWRGPIRTGATCTGLDLEICEGDLRDRESLEKGMKGCDILFHAAADYRLWTRKPAAMYEVNVGGTRNILETALRQGLSGSLYEQRRYPGEPGQRYSG